MTIYMFHGGCAGCTQQEINGVDFCAGCCFFDADWNLPDLNNRPLTPTEIKRAEMLAQMLAEKHQEDSDD